jgi:hypothetical protein
MQRRLLILLAALAVGVLFAAGLFVHGVLGGVLLLAVDALLIAMAALTWRHLRPQGRPLRIAVIAVIAVVAIVKLAHG